VPADGTTIPPSTNAGLALAGQDDQGNWVTVFTSLSTNAGSGWALVTCPDPGLGKTRAFRWGVFHPNYFPETGPTFTCERGPNPTDLTQCSSPGPTKPYANQGSVSGSARLYPGPPGLAQVTISEGTGQFWSTKGADITGHFEIMATTEPERTNKWGVNVNRTGDSGPGTRPLTFAIVGHPESKVAATVVSSDTAFVNISAAKPYVQLPCPECEKNKAPGSGGKPVSFTTGEMYFSQTDGASGEVVLSRRYSTAATATGRYGMFGPGWNTTLDQRLRYPETGVIEARQPNGAPVYYYDDNSDGLFEAVMPVSVESWIETQGADYRRVFRKGGFETYDVASGRIKSTQDAAGVITTYTRDASNRITSVTRLGRSLSFTYTGAATQPTQLKAGATVLATYAYESAISGNPLVQVTYGDGSGFVYTPDSAGRILTVSDLSGRLIESHAYDAQGRAITSEILDGRDGLTFDYGNNTNGVNQTTVTDALGRVTVYEWTPIRGIGYVTRITGPCASCGGSGGDTQTWTYDDRSNPLTYTDGLGKTTTYTYSANDELLTETNALNETTTYTYDAQGRMLTRTGPDGSVTTYIQSPVGPTSITQSVTASTSRTTSIAYDAANGKPQTITDPRGKVTTMGYDATTADLLTVTDPLSHATTFTYDAQGRRTKVTDALNHETTTTYDAVGRVTRVTNHDGTHTDFTYDKGGRRSDVTDPLGRKTRYVYDTYGRLVSVVDPANQSTRYTYDLMGNLTALTDAKNQTTTFEYDGYNRVKKTIYPGGAYETFSYDAGGRLTTMTDRKGIVTTYTYDDLGRLLGKSFANDPTNTPSFSYTYDVAGRMLTAVNGSDTLTWTYNLAGELLSEQSAANASTVAYTYDDGGNRLSVSLDGQLFVTYAYDDASRLTTITRAANSGNPALNFGFEYDNANRRTKMTYPNGVDTTYAYDNLNRLTQLAATKVSTGTPITNFTYQYDAAGNRTQKGTLDYTESYGYDALSRLSRADCTPANGSQICPGPLTGTAGADRSSLWSYDAVGNRLTAQTDANATTSSYNEKNQLLSTVGGGKMLWRGVLDEPGTVNLSAANTTINGQPARMLAGNVFEAELNLPPGANTVTIQAQDGSGNVATKSYAVTVTGSGATYTYDANGNLSQKVEGADTWVYTWNALNQLTAVSKNGASQATYKYDPLERRVERVADAVTTEWTYDGDEILRQAAPSGALTFVHGPDVDEPMATQTIATGVTTYLHADALGSTVVSTNSAASISGTSTYDAWGNMEGGVPGPYAFAGREWDSTTRLLFSRNRYYDPTAGRFISEDPIDFDGGVDFYSYVDNNPVNWIDPYGLVKYPKRAGERPNPAAQAAAECFEECYNILEPGRRPEEVVRDMAKRQLTVTGAKEGDPHKPTSKHRTGEAVDFGLNANQCLRNDRDTVDKCFTRCFPQTSYGQEETSPDHFHFQTAPGMGGAKGMKKKPTATKHYKTTPAPKKP